MKHNMLSQKRADAAQTKFLRLGDIAGWVGAVLLLGAYLAVSTGTLTSDSFWYQILNIAGAIGMFILASARRAMPSAITNIIWAIIGIVAIIGIIF